MVSVSARFHHHDCRSSWSVIGFKFFPYVCSCDRQSESCSKVSSTSGSSRIVIMLTVVDEPGATHDALIAASSMVTSLTIFHVFGSCHLAFPGLSHTWLVSSTRHSRDPCDLSCNMSPLVSSRHMVSNGRPCPCTCHSCCSCRCSVVVNDRATRFSVW